MNEAPRQQQQAETVRITLTSMPNMATPFSVRLRRLLKIAGRALGLKCVRVEDVQPDRQQAP